MMADVNATPTLAGRPGRLLAELHKLGEDWLEHALRGALNSFDQHLFRASDATYDPEQRKRLLRVLESYDRHRAKAWPAFREGYAQAIAQLPRRALGQSLDLVAPAGELRLSLLSDSEMDESLTLSEIGSRAEMFLNQRLYYFGLRLAVLCASPAIPVDVNPFAPRALSECLRAAAAAMELPPQQRVELYRHVDRELFTKLAEHYQALDRYLIDQGVLPTMSVVAPRRPRRGPPRQVAPTPNPPVDPVPRTSAPETATPAPAAPAPALGTFERLRGLLVAGKLYQAGLVPAAGPDAEAMRIGADGARALEPLLAVLHAGALPAAASPPAIAPAFIERRRNPAGAPAADPALTAAAAQADAVELVQLLLTTGLGERSHPEVRAGLERLKPMLARSALLDPSVLEDAEHPLRRLLAQVAQTLQFSRGLHQVDQALRERAEQFVQLAEQLAPGDNDGTQRLLGLLDEQLDTLARKADAAAQRQIDVMLSRQRLARARATASSAIARLLQQRNPSRLLRALLELAWQDVLVLALLGSSGDDLDAPGVRRRLQLAEAMLDAEGRGQQPLPTELAELFIEGLRMIGFDPADLNAVQVNLFEPHRRLDDDSIPGATELALRLKARARATERHRTVTTSETPTLTLSEHAALEKLRALPPDGWIEVDAAEGAVRYRVAWCAEPGFDCLLVDPRGRRGADLDLVALARGLVEGSVRISTTPIGFDDGPWQDVMAKLKTASG